MSLAARNAERGSARPSEVVDDPRFVTGRNPAIDWLKALAIVGVVMTHSGPPFWESSTALEHWLRFVLPGFHVPIFVAVAGYFTYRPRPIGMTLLGRRLTRVLVPYIIAVSVICLLGLSQSPDPFLVQLTNGTTLGHYYYIAVIAPCLLLAVPLSRTPSWLAPMFLAALVAYLVPTSLEPFRLIWPIRDPFRQFWFGYFVAGWCVMQYRDRLARVPRPVWVGLGALGIAAWFGGLSGIPTLGRPLYTASVAAFVVGVQPQSTVGVRWLSEATLAIFLYHWLVVHAVLPCVIGWMPVARLTVLLTLGILGASLLVVLARRALGPARARFLLGA